jgi:hypothetical protein
VHQTCFHRAHVTSRSIVLRVAFTAIMALIFSACSLRAHAASCAAADLDISFHFGGYPPSSYIITVLATNISRHACVLTPQAGLRFYANQTTAEPISVRLGGGHVVPDARPPILLGPSERAHFTVGWVDSPASFGPACKQAAAFSVDVNGDRNHPTELFAPTLLPPICSDLAVESFTPGRAHDDDSDLSPTSDSTLHFSSDRATYVPGEPFSLHLEYGNPAPSPGFAPCPTFFIRQRAATGTSRTVEYNSIDCVKENEADPGLNRAAEVETVSPIQQSTPEDITLQIFELTGHIGQMHLRLAESNPVTLHFAGSATRSTPASPGG